MSGELRLRFTGSTWETVGTSYRPLNIRMPDYTWMTFGGGTGIPLKVRMPDNTWKIVSRQGAGNPAVWGHITDLNDKPLVGVRVHITGEVVDHTYTDVNGNYYFPDIYLGTYYISAHAAPTYSRQFVQQQNAMTTLTEQNPVRAVDFTFMTPQLMLQTPLPLPLVSPSNEVYTPSPGWTAKQLIMMETRSVTETTPQGVYRTEHPSSILTARSVSAMGWNGDEWSTMNRYMDETVSWIIVPPIQMIRDAANAGVDEYRRFIPDATLQHTFLNFYMYGHSVVKTQLPWMSGYTWGETTFEEHTGRGRLIRMGTPSRMFTERGIWTGFFDLLGHEGGIDSGRRPMEVINYRNEWFERSSGSVVWEGSLNELGSVEHGFNRPVYKHVIELPPNYSNDYEIYHLQVDEAPIPRQLPLEQTIGDREATDNYMYVRMDIEFIYQHWTDLR